MQQQESILLLSNFLLSTVPLHFLLNCSQPEFVYFIILRDPGSRVRSYQPMGGLLHGYGSNWNQNAIQDPDPHYNCFNTYIL